MTLRRWQGRPLSSGERIPALAGYYLSTIALTITNPTTTILSFATVFARLGVMGTEGDYGYAAALVGEVFSGSALWWLILSECVGLFRARLDLTALQWVNRASGTIISAFGLLALLALLR